MEKPPIIAVGGSVARHLYTELVRGISSDGRASAPRSASLQIARCAGHIGEGADRLILAQWHDWRDLAEARQLSAVVS
jgi:hypothetical protein